MNRGTDETLFLTVRDLVARTFRVKPQDIQLESGLETIAGWDSLGHLQLMMEVETEFNIRFSVHQIADTTTVVDLCEVLASMGIHG